MTRIIDLSGPEGNAFALMGYAKTWGKQLDLDTNAIIADMMSGDYEHLLTVFESHFTYVASFINDPRDEANDEGWDE